MVRTGGARGSPDVRGGLRKLATAGLLPGDLTGRLVRAVGFRNLLVHAYADLDLARVHAAAVRGPADLRDFAAALLANDGLPGPAEPPSQGADLR